MAITAEFEELYENPNYGRYYTHRESRTISSKLVKRIEWIAHSSTEFIWDSTGQVIILDLEKLQSPQVSKLSRDLPRQTILIEPHLSH